MAPLMAALRVGFLLGLTESSELPSHARIAEKISFNFSSCILLPATMLATFCSSLTFQFMKLSISGWSASQMTIFAARRVVPPDLIAPAARSPIFKKPINPDDLPPPERGSPSPRRELKLVPVPDPYLKRRASRTQRSMMPPSLTRSSLTDWIKHA